MDPPVGGAVQQEDGRGGAEPVGPADRGSLRERGLAPGDRVVTSGVFKLRADTEVVIDNRLAPKPELAPRPGNS